ncbi:ATPase [Chromobacterium haemolyticum]|uniref:ATPase n=1 Tax=Chromobacterium haemolyticum TaxID=394935 RepID=A0ABS3GQS0_9NEIS|nr:ATPase [Chromobacterium haemolyticum]MBO0417088.1 ATPase [Chromobacterium haemolyticum]MBO0500201.1 ATPase [Chromobacterium haemolyticum]QOD80861.1 ATPase [Chromobacterium haemolyticum]
MQTPDVSVICAGRTHLTKDSTVTEAFEYRLGVDGGGSGTRVCLSDARARPLAHAEGGPSALSRGVPQAWAAVNEVIARAFEQAGLPLAPPAQCAIGLGLSGVHNADWADAFRTADPGYARLRLATDGYTTLLGAHGGHPGVIVALGTGSIGEALYPDGGHREVGGWGYPSGDEASGAWLGQRAAQYAQMALDGRMEPTPLTRAVLEHVGGDWQAMMAWNGRATPTLFAQLAPLVVANGRRDSLAAELLRQAGRDAWSIAKALDPDESLPVALCGGLGQALRDWLPPEFAARLSPPQGDACAGALLLLAA